MNTAPAQSPITDIRNSDPLTVACPICAAAIGQQCETVASGWIRPAPTPHLYRIQVAAEEVAR